MNKIPPFNFKPLVSTWKAWYKDAASAAAIVFITTNMVVASMAAAEAAAAAAARAAAAAAPAAAASLHQAFQVNTKGLKLNVGHFIQAFLFSAMHRHD